MLSELAIRFDTRPDYYTKRDYQYLITVLAAIAQQAKKELVLTPEQLTDILNRITALEIQVVEIIAALNTKQDILIAGENVTIENNVLSVEDMRTYWSENSFQDN
jgi:hypothetical protein